MGTKSTINRSGQTWFQVKQGGSYQIPDVVPLAGLTSLQGLTDMTGTRRQSVGGALVMAFSDAADGAIAAASGRDMQQAIPLEPGDTVACSAVVSNVITVTVTSRNGEVKTVHLISGVTTVGGVQGFWA